MKARRWNVRIGRSKERPSDDRICLLLTARGLPMHSEVQIIATKGIIG